MSLCDLFSEILNHSPYQLETVECNVLGTCHLEDYRLLGLVAAGANGVIFRARCINPAHPFLDSKEYAIKMCFNFGNQDSNDVRRAYRNEYSVLSALPRHPNINCFYAQFLDYISDEAMDMVNKSSLTDDHKALTRERQSTRSKFQFVVLEYFSESLEARLDEQQRNGCPLSETVVLCYLWDIATALLHLATHSRLHLDVKPNNIMLNPSECPTRPAGVGVAVLCDFGCACNFDEGFMNFMSPFNGGNPSHLSPELTNRTPSYSKQPVFELGVLGYEMILCSSNEPHHHPLPDYPMAYKTPLRYSDDNIFKIPEGRCSPELAELLFSMVRFNPENRPSLIDVVNRIMGTLKIDETDDHPAASGIPAAAANAGGASGAAAAATTTTTTTTTTTAAEGARADQNQVSSCTVS